MKDRAVRANAIIAVLAITSSSSILGQSPTAISNVRLPPVNVCNVDRDPLAERVFREYGAVFAASDEVTLPPSCIFKSDTDLAAFHKTLKIKSALIGGVTIELQEAAMNALLDAVEEIQPRRFTPLDGAIAGRRSYADTVRIWNSRFIPALNYWVSKGKIPRIEANAALMMPVAAQVAKVVDWESNGMFFGTTRTRSIFSSVAPPGTSQHLSLLAFDVVQDNDRLIREALNRNGWYQTVVGDSPHFTYLGVPETELPKRGLKAVVRGGKKFWVPLIEPSTRN
jgi:hypothetical protein